MAKKRNTEHSSSASSEGGSEGKNNERFPMEPLNPTRIEILQPDIACAEDLTVYAALPQELSMFTNPSSVLDSFWMYINLCYFLCLFPFRLARDKRCRFTVQTSLLQQVICAILHILFLLFWIKKCRSHPQISALISGGPPMTTTREYLSIVLAIAEVCYVLALLGTGWSKARVFQQISGKYFQLAKFEEEEDIDMNPVDETLPLARLLLSYGIRLALSVLAKRYVVGFVLCLAYTALGSKDFWDEYDDELKQGNELLGKDGYLVNSTKTFFYLEAYDIPLPIGNFLGIIYLVVSLLYSLLINLGNLLYGILALMLANLGNNFETLLALPDVTGPQIVGEYQQARDFVKYINEELGILTLFLVMSAVPYYASVFPVAFDSKVDRLSRLCFAANLAHYGLVLYLTSTLQEKMRRIHNWFSEREVNEINTGVSSEQQRLVSEELAQDSGALSAFGFFAVSYATIGRILQLLMTYGFISGQGKPGSAENATSIVPIPNLDLEQLGLPL